MDGSPGYQPFQNSVNGIESVCLQEGYMFLGKRLDITMLGHHHDKGLYHHWNSGARFETDESLQSDH